MHREPMLIYTYSDLVLSLLSILDESSVSASPAVILEHELISLDRLVRLPGTVYNLHPCSPCLGPPLPHSVCLSILPSPSLVIFSLTSQTQ